MALLHRNTFHPASDLFRLLDEASSISNTPAVSGRRTFSPNFDVQETENCYILEGELPGLHDKNAVHIEFTDVQTMLVKGRIERSYQSVHPRVSDTEEEEEKTKKQEGDKQKGDKQEERGRSSQPRYWVSERSVGEFQRSFSFPTPVNVDDVKAVLEHGILRITVPKVEQKKGKRITVS